MPALMIDLDDQASDGLQSLDDVLMRMAATTDVVSKSTERLTGWQREQLTVINQAKTGWADLGIAATKSMSDIAVTGIRTWGGVAEQSIKTSGVVAKAMVDQTASVAKWALGTSAAVKGIDIIWGHHRDELDRVQARYERMWGKVETAAIFAMGGVGAAMVDQIALNGALGRAGEQAAIRLGTAFLRIGPQVAGATLVIKAHEAALARTGERIDILNAKPLASQTAEQAREFERLTRWIDETGRSMQEVTKSWGVSANQMKELYGVEVTTGYRNNLDRVNEAWGGLTGTVASDLNAVKQGVIDLWHMPMELPDWGIAKKLDEDFTRFTDIQVKNIDAIKKKYGEVKDAGFGFLDMISGRQAPGAEYDKMYDERAKDHSKLDAQREKEAGSFEQLRIANDKVANAAAGRAEAERLASLKTTAAIDDELRAMSKRSGEAARAGQFDEEDGKRHLAITEYLQKRRAQVIIDSERQAAEAKKRAFEAEKKQSDERYKIFEAETKRIRELNDLEEKRMLQRSAFARDLAGYAQDKKQGSDNDVAKQAFDNEKQLTAEKMKMGGSNDSQIKTKLFQMDMEFAKKAHAERMMGIGDEAARLRENLADQKRSIDRMTGDAHAKAVAEAKWRADIDKAEFDIRKKRIDELAGFRTEKTKLELEQARQLEDAKFQKAKERLEKEKQLQEQALGKVFNEKDFMNQQDPDKVYGRIEADRVKKAQQEQAVKDKALGERAQGGDEMAMKRYKENQAAAERRAKRGLFRDAENGTVNENEVAKAQAQVAGQTVQQMQNQGVLNQNVSRVVTDQLKAIADQNAAIMTINAQMVQVQAFMKGQKVLAKQSLNQAQAQHGINGPGY